MAQGEPAQPARRPIDVLISLLALTGLRISDALGADAESMDVDRGHRTLAIVRKTATYGRECR